MKPAQARMARAALNWTLSDLATASGVHRNTISNFETERYAGTEESIAALRRALEAAGVEFIGNGVRMHEAGPATTIPAEELNAAHEKPAPKFHGELAAPIVRPFNQAPELDKCSLHASVLLDQQRKLKLLLAHYETDDWMILAWRLAVDFVPGFGVVYDDPLAATLGLPTLGGSKSGRKGKGSYPALTGDRLIATAKIFRTKFGDDAKACAAIAKCLEEAEDPVRGRKIKWSQKERASLTSTLKRRLAEAKRRASGPASIVRSKSNPS